jgi:glycosyltransferase involved in cell wall biosynthesis
MIEAAEKNPSLSVCMTAYNEEGVIRETVLDCLSVLERIPGNHEILVVNDGSTDRTGEILHELAAQWPQLRVLVHPENRGYAAAQRWLIRAASKDLIFHMAADGEWKAEELYKMLEKMREGFDIVIGVRRKKHYSLYRKAVSWIYNVLVVLLFQKNLHDIGSIRLARANVWKRVPAQSNSAFFMAEKLLLAHRNGARIGFTPVDHVWRLKGKSKFSNPLNAVKAMDELVRFRFSPLSRQRIDLEAQGTASPSPLQGSEQGRG